MTSRNSTNQEACDQYHLIDTKEDGDTYHRLQRMQTKLSTARKAVLLSNILWVTLLFIIAAYHSRNVCQAHSCGRSTDFISIRPNDNPRVTIFDDQLRYNSTSHEFWRGLDPQQPQYFGPPSPEIDSAWAGLLHGEFLGISDEEARENPDLHFVEEDRVPETGYFHIAIGVFIHYTVSMLYGGNSIPNTIVFEAKARPRGFRQITTTTLSGPRGHNEYI